VTIAAAIIPPAHTAAPNRRRPEPRSDLAAGAGAGKTSRAADAGGVQAVGDIIVLHAPPRLAAAAGHLQRIILTV
jgi:hypothetical protein